MAKGKLAAYLIEDAQIRQSLMNDIAELDAFCHGRQSNFFPLFKQLKNVLELASGEELVKIKKWTELINRIEADLASPQLQNFFKLRKSTT